MKIVCLTGSPRYHGNSTAIAKRFMETADKHGADTTTYALNKLTYKGCQACMGCKTKADSCVLGDDMKQVLDDVSTADVLVMASPIYYGDVTSQMKAFMDRTYSFYVPEFHTKARPSRLASGKKFVMISTQGQPDENMFADVFPKYHFFFQTHGFKEGYSIRGCGLTRPDDVMSRQEILAKAEELAGVLVG
ncbi:flavodoxin family protein [Desulfoluna spongiiphila]|uniref:NADPH-dependent FMN reductase n=1 Tax=Desulfoluna spongiiphila TaxID=419481 RepID=A0A1G5H8F4_9BACT|nr:flavodoxin family protein [Desulfoluna spongiiphila]SCY59967.1 NADPH-dependent FMN reductase [Desulfoluna spongiiphila]VVS94512.1 nadph-dependent fmn reductase-like [Desulfoluna spongiiphila]